MQQQTWFPQAAVKPRGKAVRKDKGTLRPATRKVLNHMRTYRVAEGTDKIVADSGVNEETVRHALRAGTRMGYVEMSRDPAVRHVRYLWKLTPEFLKTPH